MDVFASDCLCREDGGMAGRKGAEGSEVSVTQVCKEEALVMVEEVLFAQ